MKITVERRLMLFVALIAVLNVGITSVIFYYKSNELFLLILIVFSCLLGFVFAKMISRPLNSLTNLVIQTASLDFTTEESLFKKLNKRKDEIGSMSSALYEMGGVLLDMIDQLLTSSNSINENARLLHVSAEQVVEHANENSATTQELSAGLEQSAASAEEISAASEDVKQKMDSITDKAKNGADISKEITIKASILKQDALNSNETAQTLYQDVKTKMEAALQQAQTVSKINLLTETILRIAEQTNLLSLNAAIEAARAGEAGRGFSVVADEIRKLAGQSSQTVVDIQKMIELVTTSIDSMTLGSQKLLEFVDKNVKSDYQKFIDVSEQYNHDAVVINDLMADINVTAEQLDLIVTGITMTIAEVARTINEGASGVQEIAGKTGEIVYQINDVKTAANKNLENAMILKGILNKFKI
ncbi:methyl-accepting chemotaxis protein [Desulfosporosinus sp. BICA1-9]|uniref:methyl-accepting chemotaxis protein n=1 Tax=Desulfosporosinus sp. BICA1-9 TaxID=1531958 RepID=UPI000A417C0C|nr:methyl-accepting chemotaxis protein [Desulfosporosinus sp. BICA1-9]HBW38077.1 hypothetical protein [Desulfosporosinus sp.]